MSVEIIEFNKPREFEESKEFKERKSCVLCDGKLTKFLDLGRTPLADSFVEDPNKPEKMFPLTVSVCQNCWLVHLNQVVNNDILFGKDYAFFTSSSPSSIIYFRDYAEHILKEFPDQSDSIVEIASNDGLLLKYFREAGKYVLGVEPVEHIARKAEESGVPTIIDFFSKTTSERIVATYDKPGLIIANNVVAHVEDLYDFMLGVKNLLRHDGVFVFEVHYFPNIIFRNQFDNIYHEHRFFLSIHPLARLMEAVGMEIFNIERYETQGGSIRVYAKHKDNPAISKTDRIAEALAYEEKIGITDFDIYSSFQKRVDFIRQELLDILDNLRRRGKQVAGLGATAKSSTLLNYCGIGTNYLSYIQDLTPYKIGKFTPGTHIPVISPEQELNRPDYYLLLAWNYLAGILRRETQYIQSGGKFIVPIPMPYII